MQALPNKQLGITTISLKQDIVKELLTKYVDIPENLTHGIFVWKVKNGTIAQRFSLSFTDLTSSHSMTLNTIVAGMLFFL